MVFTDDDLRRLKENIRVNLAQGNELTDSMFINDAKALLARLEAAEKRSKYHIQDCHCEYCLAWRKAAGK